MILQLSVDTVHLMNMCMKMPQDVIGMFNGIEPSMQEAKRWAAAL